MRWMGFVSAALGCLLSSTTVASSSSSSHPLLRKASPRDRRILTEDGVRGMVDLVHLAPFDVQIAVTENRGIRQHEVSNVVTAWMNDSFREQLEKLGFTEENSYAAFDSVVLFNNDDTRRHRVLQQGELYTAKFRGGAVFSRDAVTRTISIPKNDVLLIQQLTLLDDSALATRLRLSYFESLGAVVVDVNAFINPTSSGKDSRSNGVNLESIIIGAIVVACVAFLFLMSAVFWAYRYDRNKSRAFKTDDNVDRTDASTENETPEKASHQYPMEIGDSNYPESVISDSVVSGSVVSEDISASLSHYYKSGMGKVASTSSYRGSAMLSDAGSVSSMESYGYSVDTGLATPLPTEVSLQAPPPAEVPQERIGGLPVCPAIPAGLDESDEGDEEEDVQIPDLDKELKILDIQLTPSTDEASEVVSVDNSSTPSQPYVGGDYFNLSLTESNGTDTLEKEEEEEDDEAPMMKLEDAFDAYWNQDDIVSDQPLSDVASVSNHQRRPDPVACSDSFTDDMN